MRLDRLLRRPVFLFPRPFRFVFQQLRIVDGRRAARFRQIGCEQDDDFRLVPAAVPVFEQFTQDGDLGQQRNLLETALFFFADEAADGQGFPVAHAHGRIGRAAVDTVVLQFADEDRRADFRVDLRRDEAVFADDGQVGQLDAGVHIFRAVRGFAVLPFFRHDRNVAADEDARFLAGQGDEARRGQNFGFAGCHEGAQRGPEAELRPRRGPEAEMSRIAGVGRAASGIAGIVPARVSEAGNDIPVPLHAQVLFRGAVDGKDRCPERHLAARHVEPPDQPLETLFFCRCAGEEQGVADCAEGQFSPDAQVLERLVQVRRADVVQREDGKKFRLPGAARRGRLYRKGRFSGRDGPLTGPRPGDIVPDRSGQIQPEGVAQRPPGQGRGRAGCVAAAFGRPCRRGGGAEDRRQAASPEDCRIRKKGIKKRSCPTEEGQEENDRRKAEDPYEFLLCDLKGLGEQRTLLPEGAYAVSVPACVPISGSVYSISGI